ncbi:MAG: MazG-like family protein [bacterium]
MQEITEKELDITKNVRAIEWLKSELLGSVTLLYRSILKGSEEHILDALAGAVLTVYLLGRRLGISFARLDTKVKSMVHQSIIEEHQLEKWYGDLSAFERHLTGNRSKI